MLFGKRLVHKIGFFFLVIFLTTSSFASTKAGIEHKETSLAKSFYAPFHKGWQSRFTGLLQRLPRESCSWRLKVCLDSFFGGRVQKGMLTAGVCVSFHSYAMPTKTMNVLLTQIKGAKYQVDSVLTTHQRVVQVGSSSCLTFPLLCSAREIALGRCAKTPIPNTGLIYTPSPVPVVGGCTLAPLP